MGEREQFPNQSQYYNANAMLNFCSDANTNNHLSMNNFYMSFSKLQYSKNLIFTVFAKAKKTKLERKHAFHFPRRTLNNEKRKSNHQSPNNDNPTKTFNESKNKSKPRSSSMQMKNVLSNQQAQEKHQTLNSQPIPGSQPVRHT
jgi:hypothetical protein